MEKVFGQAKSSYEVETLWETVLMDTRLESQDEQEREWETRWGMSGGGGREAGLGEAPRR